jgi:ubiquitin carboxyl-terminal hydrolase 47
MNFCYIGKTTEYVKCRECGQKKSKESKYRDLSLCIRQPDSIEVFSSIDESLKALMKEEELCGDNQYHCDKCMKNCNAIRHQELTTFPYILTLHLKRAVEQNIKLNDR